MAGKQNNEFTGHRPVNV